MFARHGTFYIRNGWLRKGLKALEENKDIFSPSNIGDAIDELGIGKAMVESLRYWLDVVDLTYEYREKGLINKKMTKFGEMILEKDEYFESKGTFWLLHYKIATNKEMATSWYWFFNHFKYEKFDEEIFINNLMKYVELDLKKKVSENSLKRDFQCIKNTYIISESILKNDIEDAIDCPFRELKLISEFKYSKELEKRYIEKSDINSLIMYYCILDRFKPDKEEQISLDNIINGENSIGKIFNLRTNIIYNLLEELESKEYINIYKRFGENYILVLVNDKDKVIKDYYENKNLD